MDDLIAVGKALALALCPEPLPCHVVDAENNILRCQDNGLTMRRREHVVGGHHQDPGLGLGLHGKGQVHGHLVAVKVGIVGNAYQGMKPDGLALHQDRLKCLDAEAVKRGRAIKKHTVLLDHLVKCVPYLRELLFHHLLCALDGGGKLLLLKLVVDKGLEELQRHLLGKTALLEFKVRTYHNDRTARVINTLTEEVLAKTTLLSL